MSPATGGTVGEGDLAYQMKPSGSEKARLEARFGSTMNQLSDRVSLLKIPGTRLDS